MKSYKLYALICVELHMLVLFFTNLRIFMDEYERKMNFWCSQVQAHSCTYLQTVHWSAWWLAAHYNTRVLQVSILMIDSYQLSYLCWLFFRKIYWLLSFPDLKNWCGERNSQNAESTTCASCWPFWLVSLKVKKEESLGHLTSHVGGASRAFSCSLQKSHLANVPNQFVRHRLSYSNIFPNNIFHHSATGKHKILHALSSSSSV